MQEGKVLSVDFRVKDSKEYPGKFTATCQDDEDNFRRTTWDGLVIAVKDQEHIHVLIENAHICCETWEFHLSATLNNSGEEEEESESESDQDQKNPDAEETQPDIEQEEQADETLTDIEEEEPHEIIKGDVKRWIAELLLTTVKEVKWNHKREKGITRKDNQQDTYAACIDIHCLSGVFHVDVVTHHNGYYSHKLITQWEDHHDTSPM